MEHQRLPESVAERGALARAVGALVAGRVPGVWVLPDGRCVAVANGAAGPQGGEAADAKAGDATAGTEKSETGAIERTRGVLSGSFNPLHDGHRALCEAAERRLGGPVAYELSVVNAEKPPLDEGEVLRRAAQFTDRPVVLTGCPTFVEKAGLLPGMTFVVGIDTAARTVNTRFYGGSTREMNRALAAIGAAGCRFLVAGRWLAGRFQSLSDVGVPARHMRLFDELTAEEFRHDISSTELRCY